VTLPDTGASRAVLIGAHQFADASLEALPGVANNVKELRRLLTADATWGLLDAHCTAYLDPENPVEVLAALNRAAREATDTLLVYYAGHGLIDPDDDRRLYLATPQTCADDQWYLSLRYEDFRRAVTRSPARRKVVVLDCCFSGRAITGGMAAAGAQALKSVAEQVGIEDNTCVLTAASGTATALCPPGETYSAFTGELVGLLADGVPEEHRELLDVSTLYRHLHARLSGKGRPLPQLGTRNAGSDIVLARNAAYTGPAPAVRGSAPGPIRPNTLAAPDGTFVGRRRELAELADLAGRVISDGRSMVCLVHGMGGVGKTEILRRAAASPWAEQFEDGRFEINLRGFAPGSEPDDGRQAAEARDPDEVLESLLRQVGRTDIQTDRDAREEAWRAWLSTRRVLLLLDNAYDAEQIRPLLPGPHAACLTLVSSRNQHIPAGHSLGAELLPVRDAVALLRHIAGETDESALPQGELAQLADRCGKLPVALRPMGWALRHTAVADLLAAMEAPDPLRDFPEADGPVRAAFLASYHRLPRELQLTLRHCALHPGPDFAGDTVAAMMSIPAATAALRLGRLQQRHVLLATRGRFGFHGLFRHYAQVVAENDPALRGTDVRRSLYGHLLGSLAHALSVLTGAPAHNAPTSDGTAFASADEARAWLKSHSAELELAADAASRDGWERATQLESGTGYWLYLNERYGSARSHYERALELARATRDRASQVYALNGIAETHRLQFRFGDARAHYRRALELADGDLTATSESLNGIALTYSVEQRYADARTHYEQALELARATGDLVAQVYALTGIGDTHRYEFRDEGGLAYFVEALTLAAEIGNVSAQAYALTCIGHAHRGQRRYETALDCYNRALELARSTDDRMAQAQALYGIARTYGFQGRFTEGRDQCHLAMWIFQDLGVQDWVDQCVELLRDLAADERRQ
jgi:tetratricopeptide (TPR) repeat protein